jgi:hypothetical protein
MKELDDETKAELTFLVVGQLFAFARSGEWLRALHLIESAQIWLSSNGAGRKPDLGLGKSRDARAAARQIPRSIFESVLGKE